MHKGTMRRVKLALVGLAGAAMFGSAAMAADMKVDRSTRLRPRARCRPHMTGPDSMSVDTSVTAGPTSRGRHLVGFGTVSHKGDGFLGGGQVGFNYQTGMFVFGVEGDFSWANIKGGSDLGPVIGVPLGATFNTEVRLHLDPDRPRSASRSTAGWSTARAVSPGRTTSTAPTSTPFPVPSG